MVSPYSNVLTAASEEPVMTRQHPQQHHHQQLLHAVVFFLLSLVVTPLHGQQSQAFTKFTATSTSSTPIVSSGVNVANSGVAWHTFTAYPSGNVASCSVQVNSTSAAGCNTGWGSGDVMPSSDCHVAFQIANINDVVNCLQIDVTALACTSPTGTCSVNVVYNGYVLDGGGSPSGSLVWLTGAPGEIPVAVTGTNPVSVLG